MEEVGIREFRAKISYYLNKLPIVLVKKGKPVARVERYGVHNKQKKVPLSVHKEVEESSTFEMCEKHNSFKYTCGCKQ